MSCFRIFRCLLFWKTSFGGFLIYFSHIYKTSQEILINKNIFKFFLCFTQTLRFYRHLKKLIWSFSKIVQFNNNEIEFWLVFLIILNFLKCYKSRICYEKITETWIRDMCKNAKLCIVMKMVRFFVKQWTTFHSSDFIKEINNNNIKKIGNSFFYCHLHSSQD